MYLIGWHNPTYWFKFRLLSLLMGTLTIPLVYFITLKLFIAKAWRYITTALVMISFPLIFYSSEARPYALVFFFSLLSFYLLLGLCEKITFGLLIAFYCSFFLGFLSSFSFGFISFGLLVTFIYLQIFKVGESGFRQKISDLLKVFALPVILAFLFYFKFVSHLTVLMGDATPIIEILKQAAVYLVGFPKDNGYSLGMAFIVYILLFKELWELLKEGSKLGIFCISTIMGICLYVLFIHPPFLYFRYFICFYPFLILLLCHCLFRLAERHKSWMWAIALFVLLIFVGNSASYFNFIKLGRGHYWEALEYMHERDGAHLITVGGDQDFRIPILLKFYSAFVPNAGIYYIPLERITINPPEWFILQVQEKNFHSYPLIIINQGPMYVFEKAYLYCGDFSGTNWQLYHLATKDQQGYRAHAELIGITKPNQY